MKKLLITLAIIAAASSAWGVNLVTKPYTFTAGAKADPSKVNSNFDTVYSGTNAAIGEINNAAGTKTSLTQRLGVSMNTDGTMKAAITYGGEWVNPALASTYISGTQFSVSGDHTDIYLQYRRVKVTLASSTVYGTISSASYGGGITTVTLSSSILTSPITSVEHAILSPANISIPTNYNAPTATSATSATTATTATNATQLNGQAASYYQPASTAITTSNIASQSVNYATSAGSATSATNATNAVNADTLDGNHASAFATPSSVSSAISTAINDAHSFSTNGYQRLPSGLILQWGRISTSVTNNGPISFPIAFPTACLGVFSNPIEYNGDASSRHAFSITTSTFYMRYSSVATSTPIAWFAIGY